MSDLPEIMELIRSERRGGSEALKKQYRTNRDKLFESVGDKSVERVFAPRKARLNLFEGNATKQGSTKRKTFSSLLEGN